MCAVGAVTIRVRLTPRGGRDRIEGWIADAKGEKRLAVRVSAAAESGKANAALVALLAEELGVAKSRVRIVSGTTARLKGIEITGDPGALTAAIAKLGTVR